MVDVHSLGPEIQWKGHLYDPFFLHRYAVNAFCCLRFPGNPPFTFFFFRVDEGSEEMFVDCVVVRSYKILS